MGLGPDFLGIGVQRGGTTWLDHQLRAQPGIYLPPRKELHYFSRSPHYPSPSHLALPRLSERMQSADRPARSWRALAAPFLRRIAASHDRLGGAPVPDWLADDVSVRRPWPAQAQELVDAARLLPHQGDAAWEAAYLFGDHDDTWYASLFDGGADGCVRGEVTPAYSILDEADVRRVRDRTPRPKIVLVLRDPVERDWSQYRHSLRRGAPEAPVTADAIIERLGRLGARPRSDYEGMLARFSSAFGGGLLTLFHEDLTERPGALLERIGAFLEVDIALPSPAALASRINAARPLPMPDEVRARLARRHLPMLTRLAKRLDGPHPRRWLERAEVLSR